MTMHAAYTAGTCVKYTVYDCEIPGYPLCMKFIEHVPCHHPPGRCGATPHQQTYVVLKKTPCPEHLRAIYKPSVWADASWVKGLAPEDIYPSLWKIQGDADLPHAESAEKGANWNRYGDIFREGIPKLRSKQGAQGLPLLPNGFQTMPPESWCGEPESETWGQERGGIRVKYKQDEKK